MIRSYTWNGRDVTEVEFAQRVSDLMRAGWTFQDPAAARDALLAKFEALAEDYAGKDLLVPPRFVAAELRAIIRKARA